MKEDGLYFYFFFLLKKETLSWSSSEAKTPLIITQSILDQFYL